MAPNNLGSVRRLGPKRINHRIVEIGGYDLSLLNDRHMTEGSANEGSCLAFSRSAKSAWSSLNNWIISRASTAFRPVLEVSGVDGDACTALTGVSALTEAIVSIAESKRASVLFAITLTIRITIRCI